MTQFMMIIELLDAKTQSFCCKTFFSAHMSGCCMVFAKYLPSLSLLQYNLWCKPLLILNSSSIGQIWNNAARCIQVTGVKVFFNETSRSCSSRYTYRQLYNCHNNVKSEIQAKFISLQVKLVLKSMLGSKKGFFNF